MLALEAFVGPVQLAVPSRPLSRARGIPRALLRYDRGVIAACALTARLRTARRTGYPLYGTAEHQ
ncbi:hypothetical protein AV521_45330 [Streptomyces sp. IMTB 2501]|uniref:hypothetical protein n=1 Tax=Streptomyces sp. IMTB 2501 TaxID=1776340 RepID=UPI00096CBF37|nr:hypothetical protein [Streptomyces sp. IMTB 2501]OLZ59452.1 hypothetical protein AV521_45330 [Streptomyces sp. IMTB 2501]